MVMLRVEGENLSPGKASERSDESESVAGVSELVVEDYLIAPEEMEHDYFRWMMETNVPVEGTVAVNADWLSVRE